MTISFDYNSYTDMAWGIMSGANVFVIALRNPNETPELLGDEKTGFMSCGMNIRLLRESEINNRKEISILIS